MVNNNLMRGALDAAQAALKLTSKDDAVRAEAAQALFKEPDESRLPLVEKALAAETNPNDQGAAGTGARRQHAQQQRQGQAPAPPPTALGEQPQPRAPSCC